MDSMDFETTRTNRSYTTTTKRTMTTNQEFFNLDEDIGEINALLDNSAAKHRISVRPMRSKRGSSCTAENTKLKQEKDAIIRELIETEEEFVKDLKYLITNYIRWIEEGTDAGKIVGKHSQFLFGGISDIFEFHKTVLLEGMKYYADQANQIGRSFTRLERDFDKHANYIDRMESINEFICDNPHVNEAFDNRSLELNDTGRTLIDYVRLPSQRLNDYTLLLSDLIKISKQLGEPSKDLEKGLELVSWIPSKARDLKFIQSIEGFGDTRAGRILRHDWFRLNAGGREKERYCFLFKNKLLVTKVKRISPDRSVFLLKNILQLSEHHLVEIENTPAEGEVKEQGNFGLLDKEGILFVFQSEPAISTGWFTDIREFTRISQESPASEEPVPKKEKIIEESLQSVTINGVEITDVTSFNEDRSASVEKQVDTNISKTRRVIDIPIQIESSDDTSVSENVTRRKKLEGKTKLQEIPLENEVYVEVNRGCDADRNVVPDRAEEIKIHRISKTTSIIKEVEENDTSQESHKHFEAKSLDSQSIQVEKFHRFANNFSLTKQEGADTKECDNFHAQELSLSKLPEQSEVIVHETKAISRSLTTAEIKPCFKPTTAVSAFTDQQIQIVEGEESLEQHNKQEQEENRKRKEVEEKIEEERKRKEVEEKIEEERKRKEAEEKIEEERKRKEVEEKIEEERKRKEVEEKIEEERKRKEVEEKIEEERKRKEVEEKIEEERKRKEVEEKIEEERKRKEAEEKIEEERKRKEAEEKIEEERKRKEAEEKIEEERKRKEAEEKIEEERKRKEVEEKIEEERKRKEAEEKIEEERKRKEAEEKIEEERKRKEAEEKIEEERKRKEAEEKIEEERKRKEAVEKVEKERKRAEAKEKRAVEEVERKEAERKEERQRKHKEEETRQLEKEKARVEEECRAEELRKVKECQAEEEKKRKVEEVEKQRKLNEEPVKKHLSHQPSVNERRAHSGIGESEVKTSTSNRNLIRMDSTGTNTVGKPEFSLNVKSIECEPGDNACLVVETVSDTPSIVTWLKENKPLDDKLADRVKIISKENAHTLTLLNVRDEDSGLYTAKCSNQYGATCSSGFINVHEFTPEERQQKALERQPNFIVKMKDTELLLDTTVCFIVRASGDPEPRLSFFKDDQPLKEDERVFVVRSGDLTEMTIKNVIDSDAGTYSCIAKNKYGENSTSAALTITDEKSMFPGLGSTLLEPGEEPEFTWYRDGAKFAPEDKFKVLFKDDEDSLALVFQHVRPEDAGLYTCVASTSSGKISCSAELTVQGAIHQLLREPEAPQITAELTDTEVSAGGSAMLELKITGFPKPEVTWYKDGQEIQAGGKYRFLFEDDESIALIIKGVDTNDAGEYVVIARNDLGEAKTSGKLRINSPPKFKTKMQDTACMTEETFSMSVTVSGSPEPQVKWYKDGQLIIESERIQMTRGENGVFTITFEKIKLEDSGAYSVVASNAIGQMSEFWNLVAHSRAKFTKTIESIIEIKEKETINLSVETTGNPEPEIKWVIGEKEVGKGCTYSYKSMSRTDEKITVKCSNAFGTDECCGEVKVFRGSKIRETLKNTTVQYNSNAEFTVKVDEYPKGKVKWFIDGIEIDGKKYEKLDDGDTHTLKIKNVAAACTVKVRAENEYGYDEQEARLDIIRKPEITRSLEESYTELEQKSLKLSVDVLANPEPTVCWYHNGQEVNADARIKISREGTETWSLTFNVLLPSDAGDWIVKSKNEAGEAESKTVIIVEGKPEFEKKLIERVECMESDTVAFEVKVNGSPAPVIQWSLNKDELTVTKRVSIETSSTKSTTLSKLVINNTMMEDGGIVTCVARNEHGSCETSSTLVIQKSGPKLKLDTSPRTVEVGQELKLNATVSDGAQIQWAVAGTKEKAKGGEFKLMPAKDCIVTVIATDGNGKEEKAEIPVRVMSRPKITNLGDLTCGPGDTVTFSPNIESEPDSLQVAWYRGEEKVRDCMPNDYSLQLSNVSLTEAGKYTLKAANLVGETSLSAKLTIMVEPPSFTRGLTDAKLREGDSLALRVRVIGLPEPAVTWEFDGKVISVIGKDGIYEILSDAVKLDQFGTYTVTAENCAGSVTTTGKICLVEEKPLIAKGPERSKTVDETEPFTLTATVTGSPLPTVQWFKDGEPILSEPGRVEITTGPGGVQKLLVSKSDKADEGVYSLEAKNSITSVKSSPSQVSVILAPVLPKVNITAPEEAEQGSQISLKIEIEGEPTPKLILFENDKQIDPIKIGKDPHGRPVNYFVKAPINDTSVNYAAVASNPLGKGSDQIEISLRAPPSAPVVISSLPSEKSAVEGTPVKLTSTLSGSPTPKVQWLKDGVPIPSKTEEVDGKLQTSIIIDGIGKPDAGLYTLVAENPSGKDKQECAVSVLGKTDDSKPFEAPDFTTGLPANLIISEGEDLVLKVGVSGNPLPEVQWGRLTGKPADSGAGKGEQGAATPGALGDDAKVPETTDASSAPSKPVEAGIEEGVSADSGKDNYIGAELEDGASAEPGTSHTSSTEVDSGKADRDDGGVKAGAGQNLATTKAKIDAEGAAKKPPTTPTEQLESLQSSLGLEPGVQVEQSFDGKNAILKIPGMRRNYEGPISVQLTNPLGSKTSTVDIGVRRVYTPAKIVDKFNDVHQVRGGDARFSAKVAGEPRPELQWLFNDNPLILDVKKYGTKWDGKTGSLTVYNVGEQDLGKYKLIAKNLEGSDECEGTLMELSENAKPPPADKGEKPYFLKKIADAEVYDGMAIKFTACVGGSPEPDFHWFKDDARVYPGGRIAVENNGNGLLRLVISQSGPQDLGVYTLKIFNKYGEDKCSANCTMEDFHVGSGTAGDSKTVRKQIGPPNPLPDKPIISSMTDRHLTLSWKPALRTHIDYPVTYTIEMCNTKDNNWFTLRSGIKGCSTEVRNLETGQDYKFRVRVENRIGISDPSPYAQTLRYKFEWKPTAWTPPSGDYDLNRPPHPGFTHAPKFLNKNTEQYGAPNCGIGIEWWLYGYPKPAVSFFFNGEPLSSTDHVFESNGRVILYVDKLSQSREGWYECVGVNEHGEDRYKIQVLMGEHPKWIVRLQETHILERRDGKLYGVVTGRPQPEFRWYKDWSTLGESSRIKFNVLETEAGTFRVSCTLTDSIMKDHGLYSCTASNIVGTASSSGNVNIDEAEDEWRFRSYNKRLSPLSLRNKPIRDFYHFGDELGRGTQGVIRHATGIQTGVAVAIKSMDSQDANKREWMRNEFNIHSELFHPGISRVYDGYQDERGIHIVSDICTGGDLVGTCISRGGFSEQQVADYIRQLLMSLDYMHNNKCIAHLGINALDLIFSHEDSDTLRLVDFGLARRITSKLERLDYGHPEFASPEALNGEGVGYSSDMWSVGVVTYLLLNGTTPFLGDNDQEVMNCVKKGEWEFFNKSLSENAQDFIRKLLHYDPRGRLDVRHALEHPWISRYFTNSDKKVTSSLHSYKSRLTKWYENASCKTVYRRNAWSMGYSHPSKMIYPIGVDDFEMDHGSRDPKSFAYGTPNYPRPDLNIDVGIIKSESHYQQGPDTYLLQLRDADFPARLRQYMKVAATRSPTFALQLKSQAYDRNNPIIRERRRFQEVMDEEVKEESRLTQAKEWRGEPRRLRHEVGLHLDTAAQADAIVSLHKDGLPAFIREGPAPVIRAGIGDKVVIPCIIEGLPEPTVQWFKNDIVMGKTHRIDPGTTSLTIDVFDETDYGLYKLSARNTAGSCTAKFRIVHGHFAPPVQSGIDYSVETNKRSVTEESTGGFSELLRDGVFGLWSLGSIGGGEGKLAQRLSTPVQDVDLRSSLAHSGFLRLGSLINESSYLYFVYQECSSDGYMKLVDKFIKEGIYNENDVSNAVQQILQALNYIQWRGLQLLNLNLDNVLADSLGNIKLFDTSAIARVARIGTVLPIPNKITQYTAPEVVAGELVHTTTDMWAVGCIVYSLLSGCWPFAGEDDKETKGNIQYARYRFEPLYTNSTPEATRFLMMIFKKCPLRRPTIEEVMDNRWLSTQESLIRKRTGASFKSQGLEKLVTSSFVINP